MGTFSFPGIWNIWSSLASNAMSLSAEFAVYLAPSQINNGNSFLKLSLYVTNKNIYQKGLSISELKMSSPQTLSGTITLMVFRPIKVKEMELKFYGKKSEAIYELSQIKNANRAISEGKKKIDYGTIVDERYTWLHPDSEISIGIYTYPFTFMIDPTLPESIKSNYLNITYNIEICLTYETNNKSTRFVKERQQLNLIRCMPDFSPTINDPINSTGNWRDTLVYEFNLPNKIAFQSLPYKAFVYLYPIEGKKFEIYSYSIFLIQQLNFDIVEFNNTRPIADHGSKRHTETSKFLLYKRLLNSNNLVLKDGYYDFSTTVKFPAVGSLNDDSNGCKLKKSIHPYVTTETDLGFSSTHVIKVCFELSESSKIISDAPNTSLLEQRVATSSKKSLNTRNIPQVTEFRRRRSEYNKFQKVELSFSCPIILLSSQASNSSISLPLYSHISDPVADVFQDLPSLKHFEKCENLNNILPPRYETVRPLCSS